jgi:hypothetical protein
MAERLAEGRVPAEFDAYAARYDEALHEGLSVVGER